MMKRYCASFYNYLSQGQQTIFILAENEIQAKETAILYMLNYCGDDYTGDDIDSLIEMDDNYFVTYDQQKARYKQTHNKPLDESVLIWYDKEEDIKEFKSHVNT